MRFSRQVPIVPEFNFYFPEQFYSSEPMAQLIVQVILGTMCLVPPDPRPEGSRMPGLLRAVRSLVRGGL